MSSLHLLAEVSGSTPGLLRAAGFSTATPGLLRAAGFGSTASPDGMPQRSATADEFAERLAAKWERAAHQLADIEQAHSEMQRIMVAELARMK